MKRKIGSITIVLALLFLGFCFLKYAHAVMSALAFSLTIWQNQLFPALFPFFLLSSLLIQYGFVDFLGEWGRPLMSRIFHLPGESSFVLAMSMVSGFPSGAKYTAELVKEGKLTCDEGNRLLTFTHFSNPLFIIGTVGTTLLGDSKLGLLILISHFLSNLPIGILYRSKQQRKNLLKSSLRRALSKMHQRRINNPNSFGQILSQSIQDTIKTLVLMLGIVSFFLMLTTLIETMAPLEPFSKTLLSGLLEMTQGVNFASLLPYSIFFKGLLMSIFLSFGGLSVHMQVLSIIGTTPLKYRYFFTARLTHALLTSLLYILLYNVFV